MDFWDTSIWLWLTIALGLATLVLAVVVVQRRSPSDREELIEEKESLEARCAMLEARLHQSQRLETVATLAHSVAHDYSNLLTIMTMQSGPLAESVRGNHEATKALNTLNDAIEAAGDLTSALVSFSRKQAPQPKRCRVDDAIQEGIRLLRQTIPGDVSLELDMNDEGAGVWADRCQLQQVVVNLMINGLEAMREGGVLTVRSCVRELSEDRAEALAEGRAGSFVLMSVEDTGAGMDEAVRSRIFEPGFAGPTSRTQAGVGLSIVRSIVRTHDAWIDVRSQLGQGTQFHIFWPVVLEEDQNESGEAPALVSGNGHTVLVVGDQSLVLAHARTALEAAGFRVLIARHCESACRVLMEHEETSVVVAGSTDEPLDLERICAAAPNAKVLMINGSKEEVAGAGDGEANGVTYLDQPFALADLTRAVTDLLGGAANDRPNQPVEMGNVSEDVKL